MLITASDIASQNILPLDHVNSAFSLNANLPVPQQDEDENTNLSDPQQAEDENTDRIAERSAVNDNDNALCINIISPVEERDESVVLQTNASNADSLLISEIIFHQIPLIK